MRRVLLSAARRPAPAPRRPPAAAPAPAAAFSSAALRAGRPSHAGMLPRAAVHLPDVHGALRGDDDDGDASADRGRRRASLFRASLLLHHRTPHPFSVPAGGAGHRVQTRDLHATARRDIHPVIFGLGAACALLAVGYVGDAAIKWQEKRAALPKESAFGKRFYKGAFEPKMTRREAALILGVRESANRERVREAHRRVLMLNHPDTGGSTLLATKINQAKEMLLGGGETSTTDF